MKSKRSDPVDLLPTDYYKVRLSKVHGNGVFASRKISAGARIIEYGGKPISEKQADQRFGLDPDNPHHTFFFSLANGRLI
ncbi:MAG: SET domain-containing protein-lysine N-methyltransferase, partial [Burkholderiaceae bacterium]